MLLGVFFKFGNLSKVDQNYIVSLSLSPIYVSSIISELASDGQFYSAVQLDLIFVYFKTNALGA